MKTVIAFDFGASSGRAIKATFDGKNLNYEEIHRFDNEPLFIDGRMCHDFNKICKEIDIALEKGGKVDSVAFDTWGVDYGLLDERGQLIDLPTHYRDERTNGATEKAFSKISPEALYEKTGNQIMQINTLFQLLSEKHKNFSKLLFMPDLFSYYLSGNAVCEKTIASTSQMFDMEKGDFNSDVLSAFNIDKNIFGQMTDTAKVVGEKDGVKIIAVAGHDTQCAVAAMPKEESTCAAFLSCGTWSLIGCETDKPILTEKSRLDELSNEMGANGKINYLKNISGLWLIQETKRALKREGLSFSYNDLEQLARKEEPFKFFIDPDHPSFATSGNLPERIREYCKNTGQGEPENIGSVVRCIYESLAMKYRFAIRQIEENTGKKFQVLHLLGGGTKDSFLCQMTADSLGIPVVAGPTEATALGNIFLQLIALGEVEDINAARDIIRQTEKVKTYSPESHLSWLDGYKKYEDIILK
ncbi:MAG: rhamnulokinase family protein [Acutalibacteraceae bacterium]